MAKQNRTTLKGYFETGDIPNQTQYGHLIDSNLNLSDTNAQIAASEISASALLSETFISASGDISAKGFVSASGLIAGQSNGSAPYVSASNGNIFVSGTGSFGQIIVSEYKDINLKGDLTASGNVSASGYVSCSALVIAGSEIRGIGGDVTASGTIKANKFVGPLETSGVTSTGTGTFTDIDTGQGATEVYLMNQNVRTSDDVIFADVSSSGNIQTTGYLSGSVISSSGNIKAQGKIEAATVNTGQGANELYAMNQNVRTSDAVTFTTVNTGQGANELYAMNQNVRNYDSTTFKDIRLTGESDDTSIAEGGSLTFNSRKIHLAKVVIESVERNSTSGVFTIENNTISDSDVIVCSTNQPTLTVQVIKAGEIHGGYSFVFYNTSADASDPTTTAQVSCTAL